MKFAKLSLVSDLGNISPFTSSDVANLLDFARNISKFIISSPTSNIAHAAREVYNPAVYFPEPFVFENRNVGHHVFLVSAESLHLPDVEWETEARRQKNDDDEWLNKENERRDALAKSLIAEEQNLNSVQEIPPNFKKNPKKKKKKADSITSNKVKVTREESSSINDETPEKSDSVTPDDVKLTLEEETTTSIYDADTQHAGSQLSQADYKTVPPNPISPVQISADPAEEKINTAMDPDMIFSKMFDIVKKAVKEEMAVVNAKLDNMKVEVDYLKKEVVEIQKSISNSFESSVRVQLVSVFKSLHPDWEILFPVSGKELKFSQYENKGKRIKITDTDTHLKFEDLKKKRLVETNFESAFQATQTFDSAKSAFPLNVEADAIMKIRTADGVTEYSSPTTNKSLSTSIDPLPQTHIKRAFHFLVVAEISRSHYLCKSADSFGSDNSSLHLLFKFLQLERVIWSIRKKYNAKSSDLVNTGCIISPSFNYISEASSLIDKILESYPNTFPEIVELHKRKSMWLLGC
ncbi:hypothetical protein HK098_000536 [Nowakowskiella sp. JEL0407]|nr:hypothetical protein HK098_000536 [Nowakowskiella sp. JEL0407]